jgi:hypothetical protein
LLGHAQLLEQSPSPASALALQVLMARALESVSRIDSLALLRYNPLSLFRVGVLAVLLPDFSVDRFHPALNLL